MAGVHVFLVAYDEPTWAGSAATREDGGIEFRHLVPGRYRLRVRRGVYGAAHAWCIPDDLVVPDDTPRQAVKRRAMPAGLLVTRLADERFLSYDANRRRPEYSEAGRLSYGSHVEVVHRDRRRWRAHGLYRGRAPYPWSLPPGSYELIVTPTVGPPYRTTFDVRAGEEIEVSIALAR